MLVTDFRRWWTNHYTGDFFRYVGDFLNVFNRSPTSQTCHQHIWSRTSVTDIDVFLCLASLYCICIKVDGPEIGKGKTGRSFWVKVFLSLVPSDGHFPPSMNWPSAFINDGPLTFNWSSTLAQFRSFFQHSIPNLFCEWRSLNFNKLSNWSVRWILNSIEPIQKYSSFGWCRNIDGCWNSRYEQNEIKPRMFQSYIFIISFHSR